MKRFACGDVFPGCDVELFADTDEEVLSAAGRHAGQAHQVTVLPESVIAQVRAHLRDV